METIGRYRLDRRLGAGSFATVWLGHDDDLDVPVAVKVLAENWASNEDVRHRFLAEARILRRIHDRRIVQVYDIGSLPDGRPYFVMDFINGGSLDDLRKRGVDPVRALRLCAEACRALDVLHTNHVIHRDVTPGNLLLNTSQDGQTHVLLADLGVAKSMVDMAGATMTAGTPSYMAPEQATGSAALDRRADIYSLTALTYAMLTGKPPFLVRNISDIISRDDSFAPAPISATLGAPASLDAVMRSGLATSPSRRPPTALILGQALDVIADQMSSSSAAPPATVLAPPMPTPAPQPIATPVPPAATALSPRPVTATPIPTPSPAQTFPPQSYPPQSQSAQTYSPQTYPPQPYVPQTYPPQSYPPQTATPQTGTPTTAASSSPVSSAPAAETHTLPPQPAAGRPPRRALVYVLLAAGAIALFTVSLFVTILVLRP